MSTVTEAQKLIENHASLIDVREPSEYAASRLPGAKLVPLGALESTAATWDRSQPVLLYCQSGRRSERGRQALAQLGFQNVSSLEGGIQAWAAAGLPTEKSANAPWALERQVRLVVGLFVSTFTALGIWGHPGFFALDFFIAAGLIFSAVTNTCGMALVLTKMPWNKPHATA